MLIERFTAESGKGKKLGVAMSSIKAYNGARDVLSRLKITAWAKFKRMSYEFSRKANLGSRLVIVLVVERCARMRNEWN